MDHLLHLFVVKLCCCLKLPKVNEKEAGDCPIKKDRFEGMIGTIMSFELANSSLIPRGGISKNICQKRFNSPNVAIIRPK